MPSDIRSFFGGGGGAVPNPKPAEARPKKQGRARKVVSDDEEDEIPVTSKKQTTPRKRAKETSPPKETTADDFFGKDSKPKRSEDAKPKDRAKQVVKEPVKQSKTNRSTPKKNDTKNGGSARSSGRKAKMNVRYTELDENDFPDDDLDDVDDNFKSIAMVGRRMDDDYDAGSQDDEDEQNTSPTKRKTTRQKNGKLKDDNQSELAAGRDTRKSNVRDAEMRDKTQAASPIKKSNGRKRKSSSLEEEGEDDGIEFEEAKPVKKRATPVKRQPVATKPKVEEPQTSTAMKAIFDSIPTVEAPPPPSKAGDGDSKAKFQFGQHANSAVPAGALDESEIPQGADNCLAGLTFVFTGQLQRLGREQGQNLVKRYGGKVTGAPSKKTSYVVLGEDAGPKKLEVIQQHGLTTINEDGLFELIKRLPANGGDSAAAAKQAEKLAKEEENIRQQAEEMEKQEHARIVAAKAKAPTASSGNAQPAPRSNADVGERPVGGSDSRLWTVRYAPDQLSQICGNKGQVEKLARWLRAFPKNQRTKFKMPGPDGSGTFRAVIIHGPPGIGKTTAAHLIAKLEGYDVVESNASDTRSKKLVETGLKGVLSATSILGYFGGVSQAEVDTSKKKLVLIMDEVDGMSAGDRGGVGALAAVCKKTQIPMILICNDRKLPKMRPFDFVTFDLPFRRPTPDQIRSRMMTIAYREKLNIPPNVINALIEGCGADIRQVVNMISTAKLGTDKMTFEEGKDMSKAWEKHIVLKPWDMVSKILGGGLFNAASKSTLNDKQELYFNDHEFAPLMLQENYLGTNPQRSNKYNSQPKLKSLASLDLVSRAADAISEGDLVDRMIHGSQQQWSLMPTHAMFSFVRPASFVYGSQAGTQTRFTAWLGKNSNQGKLMRIVKEIQGHMRLRVSADRHEVRQTYMPLLFDRLVRRLESQGKESVPSIIELMDEYYLTKEDWDGILELGVGKNDQETVKIESSAKATFTRLYNQQSHPMPFMKASQVIAPKRGVAKEKPDLEEAIDESDEEVAPADDPEADAKEEDADADLSKDKYVKQPKKKKAPASSKASAKAGPSGKKRQRDDEDEEESEEKPKKSKGKGRAKK